MKIFKGFSEVFLALVVVFSWVCPAQAADTDRAGYSLNSVPLERRKEVGEYVFFAVGHIYGNPQNRFSVFPAASIVSSVDLVNGSRPEFFISLGDSVRSSRQPFLKAFKTSIADRLASPVLNAVGNHDISVRYKEFFNLSGHYYSFLRGSEYFIVLDTETSHGEITGGQLEFLKHSIGEARGEARIKNIFIFTHKLIWSVGEARYAIVYENVNNQKGYSTTNNFAEEVLPLVKGIKKAVYFISGDIGCHWTLPFFYDRSDNVTFMAAGMGDTIRDALLKVLVKDSRVSFELISFTGERIGRIEDYDLSYWKKAFGK